MVRRKKHKFKRIYLYLFAFVFLIAYLLFSRPGQYFISWLKYKSQSISSEKITRLGVPIPSGYEVFGIDVSRYQNKIDWTRVSDFKSGRFTIEFAFIKATEGKSLKDPAFTDNWANAKAVGIMRGAYHYYKPNINAESQATHFCNNVSLQKGDLPPVLDIEEFSGNKEKFISGIQRWLNIVENKYKVKPIIYTGASFYNNYIKNSQLEKYPLWIAHYYEAKPYIFSEWKIWQFNDRAKIDGISGFVDVNVFNGDKAELEDLTIK